MAKKIVGILLSGGLDSTALAYMRRPDFAFNINYGQKAANAERMASVAICRELGIKLVNIDVDCSNLGSGDLVTKTAAAVAPQSDWWPYRNQLLLTLCCMKALDYDCTDIEIGTVKSDGYHKDGTLDFVDKMNDLISYQEGNISINAPAISMTSVELIKTSNIPFSLLAWSHSCHKANQPCTNCRGCNKHYNTLKELGLYHD